MKKKELIKNLILLLIVLIFCFIVLEITTRIIWQDPTHDYPPEIYLPDDQLGYTLKPNFNGFFTSNSKEKIELNLNSKGLRDTEHIYEKSEKIRILVLGDSVTLGAGVKAEESYIKQLETMLVENNYNLEVINTGVSGYELDQQYNFYKKEGYKYSPDILMIGIVLNDILQPNITKIKQTRLKNLGKRTLRTFIKSNCRLCKFTYYSLRTLKQSREEYNQAYFEEVYSSWKDEELFNEYKKKIEDLNKNVTKNKGQLILVIFPYTQQFTNSQNYGTYPQEKILTFAKENNIQFIDLTSELDFEDYKNYYLMQDNVHLNAKGYNIVANKIYKELTSTKILE
jgi:lysophospholipase L1-like esterase